MWYLLEVGLSRSALPPAFRSGVLMVSSASHFQKWRSHGQLCLPPREADVRSATELVQGFKDDDDGDDDDGDAIVQVWCKLIVWVLELSRVYP